MPSKTPDLHTTSPGRTGLSVQFFAALVLAAFAGLNTAFAQAEIYRVIDENGNISFSDKPPVGSEAEAVEIDESAQNTSLSSEAIQERQPEWLREAQEKRQAEEASKRAAAPSKETMSAWQASLSSAKQKLRDAKQAQKKGIVVSEGDFIGKAGGGVRPSLKYFEKLKKLDQDVIDAQAQLDAVRAAKPR